MTHIQFTEEHVENVVTFYRRYMEEDIQRLIQHYPNDQKTLWVDVDNDLFKYDSDLAEDVKDEPTAFIDLFEEAIAAYDQNHGMDLSDARVRFNTISSRARKVDEIRNEDVDTLISIDGQISKATAIRPVVETAAWECQRCGVQTNIPVANELTEPHQCEGCERQGPFILDYHKSDIRDHQLIRITQPPEEATNSSQDGGDIDAHLKGDLVGQANAGDRADIPGVLKAEVGDTKSATLNLYFDAHNIQSVEDDYRDLEVSDYRETIESVVKNRNPYEVLAGSIAPGITGGADIDIETPWGETHQKYWWIRLAVGVANLFGSWRRKNGDGTFQRGDSHTLMIGDPATGKSTIMDAVTEIAPRSASESGKNASGAGLTAAAVNDDFGDNQWSLEAGALVKAHNGVAAIDEIDKMRREDLDRLHSALERQRLEFNKAGIDATLKAETSMLASGNPSNSRFSDYESDQSQIDIVESLLDRFDLVYTLKDVPDEEKDRQIARSKIRQQSESGLVAKNELEASERTAAKPTLSPAEARAWVAIARKQVEPVIRSEDVMNRLEDYYVKIRQANANTGGDEPVPATVRKLDALLRLSEASARLRLSEDVEEIDVEVAIALVKVSLEDIGYDPESGKMDADWAEGRESWTQQGRIEKVKGIINTLETDENGAIIEDVITTAADSGMDESKARNAYEKLKTRGEAYKPDSEHVRLT